MQLKGAQLHYPVHEKELLGIIRALKKWRADLLGNQFEVFTDHRTLENFQTQKALSRRQARWMEEMAQFDMSINYIRGEDNTVADALSRLPDNPTETVPDCDPSEVDSWKSWLEAATLMHSSVPVMAVQQKSALLIATDERVLKDIRNGYLSDEFCKKFVSGEKILPNVREVNGLWYIGDRLLIPRTGNIREQLFRLAHDSLGHFGADKAYGSLRDAYYWPNMRRDLELSYIPSCEPCQRNKSRTSKIPGPLHPLPVPEKRGESVAIDFIGPLPEDGGFNCIATFTDRIGADVRIVPCKTTLTAEGMAQLFFDSWYLVI